MTAHQPTPARGPAERVVPSASVVILDAEGRVLLQKRDDFETWGIPGGRVEIGEDVKTAAIREVKEETGLDVELVRLVGVYSDPQQMTWTYPNGKTVQYVGVCFLGRPSSGELRTCAESIDLAWFKPGELPEPMPGNHRQRIVDALAGGPVVVQ